jgi:hypothetical protein
MERRIAPGLRTDWHTAALVRWFPSGGALGSQRTRVRFGQRPVLPRMPQKWTRQASLCVGPPPRRPTSRNAEPSPAGWRLLGRAGKAGLNESSLIRNSILKQDGRLYRSTGSTNWAPLHLSYLAKAHSELDQFDDAWRCIGEVMTAIQATKERRFEAEVNRTAGEIALMSHEPDAAKAERYFERAIAVARQQQARAGNCGPQ